MIIADIKNSTLRKRTHKEEWRQQTKLIYDSFSDFTNMIVNITRMERVVLKFTGDGMMSFFKHVKMNEQHNSIPDISDPAQKVLNLLNEYVNEIHELDILKNLRLKTIMTYLTNITILKTNGSNDVLGRGIDFSFRFEKFADSYYVVRNELVCKALENHSGWLRKDFIPISKSIKGWDSELGEKFYPVTNINEILNGYSEMQSSIYEDNVKTELFKYFIRKTQESLEALEQAKENTRKWKLDEN